MVKLAIMIKQLPSGGMQEQLVDWQLPMACRVKYHIEYHVAMLSGPSFEVQELIL